MQAQSQGMKRKMADDYFSQLEYDKAAPIYDELATANVKGKRNDITEIKRAAESYFMSVKYDKAEKWYVELEKKGGMNEEDYLNYFQVLCFNQKQNDAFKVMETVASKYPSNHLAQKYVANPNYMNELKSKGPDAFKLKPTRFTTGWGDFSPTFFDKGLVFASRKKFTGFVNRKFTWDNSHFTDMYYVSKKGDQFKKLSVLLGKTFRSKPHDGPASFNKAGDFIVFNRNDASKTGRKEIVKLMLYASRKNEKGKWSNPEALPFNSKSYSVGHPALSPDGNTLYFASDMPGGQGGVDIWKSTYNNGNWSTPINLGKSVNSPGDEMFPTVDNDGNVYFASNGHIGMGGLDIFKANASFTEIENLGASINSHADDFGLIVNEEGKLGYMTSNREGFIDRIYETEIKIAEFMLNGILALDDCNKTPLPNASVVITNNTKGTSETLTTDSQGKFTLKLGKNSRYELDATKEGYVLSNKPSVSTEGKLQSENFETTLLLASPIVKINALSKDATSTQPISDVKITIKQKSNNQTTQLTTDKEGKAHATITRNIDYVITASAPGYVEYSSEFNSSGADCNNELSLNMLLTKVKKGDVFVFNNIFYDYGKATLRAESITELNRLVEFLRNNKQAKVELSSHTDSRSSSSFNQDLSQRRAQSVVNYLIKNGIPKTTIVAKGYGEDKLTNRCSDGVNCSEDEHQQNRRTEIKILELN